MPRRAAFRFWKKVIKGKVKGKYTLYAAVCGNKVCPFLSGKGVRADRMPEDQFKVEFFFFFSVLFVQTKKKRKTKNRTQKNKTK